MLICNERIDLCSHLIAGEPGQSDRRDAVAASAKVRDDLPMLKLWDRLSDEEVLAEMVRAHAAHGSVGRAVLPHVAAMGS